MYRCLCVSMLFMVLIMIVFLSELGKYIDENGNKILTTQQLRGMYIEDIVDENYENIYNIVVQTAINGKNAVYFNIICIQSQVSYSNNECNNYDGYQEWLRRKYGENIPKNNKPEIIRSHVINKLQNAFPDSNITKSYKNCCDQYKITW